MWKLLIFFCLFSSTSATLKTVPVLLLDFDKTITNIIYEANPFSKMSAEQFEGIIRLAAEKNKVVLVFTEEFLCMEDISIKDHLGTPFSFIRHALRQGNARFIPSVMHPYKSLTKTLPQLEHNTYYLSMSSNHRFRIYDGRYKHLYVNFKDRFNQSRVNLLKIHDVIMKAVYNLVRQAAPGPVTAFYTGKINPITIKQMNFKKVPVKEKKNPDVIVSSKRAMFRLMGVYTSTGIRRSSFNQPPEITAETWNNRKLTTRMSYSDFEIEFKFSLGKKEWILDDVALLEGGEEVGRTKVEGGAPWMHSYVCGEPILLVNARDGSTVTISRYQIQPKWFDARSFMDLEMTTEQSRGSSGKNKTGFGDHVLCAPYFPSSILACLFVTFICLGILMYGITSLYNVHSNDRYDDAQGKPLVIISDGSN